jgi:hypothetical protein
MLIFLQYKKLNIIVIISEIRWKLWMFICSVCDFMVCYTFLEWSQVLEGYTHAYR